MKLLERSSRVYRLHRLTGVMGRLVDNDLFSNLEGLKTRRGETERRPLSVSKGILHAWKVAGSGTTEEKDDGSEEGS